MTGWTSPTGKVWVSGYKPEDEVSLGWWCIYFVRNGYGILARKFAFEDEFRACLSDIMCNDRDFDDIDPEVPDHSVYYLIYQSRTRDLSGSSHMTVA